MILGLSSADGGMTVGLWNLSSLNGRRPPWYRPQVSEGHCWWLSSLLQWAVFYLWLVWENPVVDFDTFFCIMMYWMIYALEDHVCRSKAWERCREREWGEKMVWMCDVKLVWLLGKRICKSHCMLSDVCVWMVCVCLCICAYTHTEKEGTQTLTTVLWMACTHIQTCMHVCTHARTHAHTHSELCPKFCFVCLFVCFLLT